MVDRKQLLVFLLFLNTFWASAEISVKKINDLPKKMYETSGLVVVDDYLVTHNDGGNRSELYVLDKSGKHLKTIKIANAKNYDWEDLALDKKGNLYIGDFGNNYNQRQNLKIHIIKKGFLDKKEVFVETIDFEYEDQKSFPPKKSKLNFDCEAFICKDGKIFLFSKCRTKPFTGISKIYMLPAKPGHYEAKLLGQFQFCKKGWMSCSVTSADYHEKSNTLSVLTYSRLYIIKNFHFNAFWKGSIKSYKLPKIRQREAICFYDKNRWYMTAEYRKGFKGGSLYRVKISKKKK